MSTSTTVEDRPANARRFAWLATAFAIWIVAGLFVLAYGYDTGASADSVVSLYHLPFYSGVTALAITCLALVIRARRAGRPWRTAFPPGYGLMVAGVVLLVVWPILEIGWREGVGIGQTEVEQLLAPSRIAGLFLGILLVAVAPLRAAQLSGSASGPWPAAISAALVFSVLGALGIQPAQRAWLEAAPSDPIARGEVWAMDGDGSHQTRLIVPPPGFDVGNAVWSADGSRIAYVRNATPAHQGESPADTAIWVANADGSDQHELISGTGWYWLPHWSPDGQWITFTIDAQHGPGSGAGVLPPAGAYGQAPGGGQPSAVTQSVDIWRIHADGSGAPEQLSTDPAEDRAAVYSPDGLHLLFDSTRAAGHTALYVADADGSNAVRVTYFGDDWGGSWSPDGKRIAFNANPLVGPYDIYVADLGSPAEPRRLNDDPAGDAAPTWSPDGTRIAFSSDRADGKNDIWSIAADGSDLRNLTQTGGATESFTSGGQEWGPDGRILYSRSQDAQPPASSLVRENLGVAEMLLGALVLAILVIVLVGLGAPFGAVALIMTMSTITIAALSTADPPWRFVPASFIGGLLVDVAIRLAPDIRKAVVGAVGAAMAFVLSVGATVIATSILGWGPPLLIGVALAAAVLAGGAALLLARPVAAARDDGAA